MADNTINYNLIRPGADDFYNIQEFNDNMTIIDTELKKLDDGKSPSGHGLGVISPSSRNTFIGMIPKGGGFYTVGDAEDSPLGRGDWLSLLQLVRDVVEGKETGSQLAFYEFAPSSPRMWFRTMSSGAVGNWVEMLHTGNIGKYADAKFACGTYAGALSGSPDTSNGITTNPFYRSKTLPLPFKADYIDIICVDDYTWRINIARNVNKAILTWQDYSVNQKTSVKWSGNNVTWGNNIINDETGNLAVMNNAGYTYAWFAYGKGEGV